MKNLIVFGFVVIFCFLTGYSQDTSSDKYAETITVKDLKKLLYVYASDYFQGRETGTIGQQRASDFLKTYYKQHGVEKANGTNDYYQSMDLTIKEKKVHSENVVAFIEGSEFPNEYLIISAHLDHIGIKNGLINNGADDDGSGTVALLEIGEAFKKAIEDGNPPKRSLLFLHVTGEEKGLLGSKYYVTNPLYPLKDAVANLNIDMIGRSDPKRKEGNPNYIYLIGSNRLSQELHDLSEEVNKRTMQIELDYTYNAENDPNRFYFRSDHYNFAKNNIPVIFYFNGTHQDYHKPTDEVDKIEFELYKKRVQLIFHTAWEIVNRNKKISLTEQ